MQDPARVYPPRIREVEPKRTTDFAAELNPAQSVVNGDFFTIYDFAGLVPASNAQPANWLSR